MFGRDVLFGGSARFGITASLKQRASKRSRRERSRRKSAMHATRLFPEFLEQRAMMAIDMELVPVRDAGNVADQTTGYGSVAEAFQMGQYEVTRSQYMAFLNAVAKTDPAGLYNPNMATDARVAGIRRAGSPGSYIYRNANTSNSFDIFSTPITYVSWFDAARFANWMSNGQPTGAQGPTTTEDGAYTLNGAVSGVAPARNAVNPNTGAAPRFFIPSEDQWYKAAYFSPQAAGANGAAGYFRYATKSDELPANNSGAAIGANYFNGVYSVTQSSVLGTRQVYLTNTARFLNSTSFYRTYDQNGNVSEWNDLTGTASNSRGIRGGSWNSDAASLAASGRTIGDPAMETSTTGFRLASPMPTLTLNLFAANVPENSSTSGGLAVGALTTANATVAAPRFTVRGADAQSFEVRGNTLFLRSGVNLDFESKNSYSVTVGFLDPVPTWVATDCRLAVGDVNEAPRSVRLINSVSSLVESVSTASRVKLADIVVIDPDANPGPNSLIVTGSDAASFEIVGNSLFLRAGVTLNAAAKSSYFVTVAAADSSVAGSTAVTVRYNLLVTRTGTAPGVPTNFTATATSAGSATLRWSPPTTDGGSVITRYRIEFRTSTRNSQWSAWQVWTPNETRTSVTLTGLRAGVIYGFRVRAENAVGAGAFTNASADIRPSV